MKKMPILLATVIFISSLTVRLWGLNSAGNVWDEYFYYDAMRDYVRNFTHLDFNADHWMSNNEHPPLGKYIYIPALVWNKASHIGGKDAYASSRFISSVIGSATVMVVFLIGSRFFSKRIGVIAAIIYGLLPPVIGYHKIINLDVTMVFFWTLAMYFFLSWLAEGKIRPLWSAVLLAGLAIATKFNGLLIALVFYPTLIFSQWKNLRATGAVAVPLVLLLLPVTSGLILIAVWPWLWQDGLDHFLKTLGHWGGVISEQFLGRHQVPPASYFLIHFFFGAPVVILFLMAIGVFRLVKSLKTAAWSLIFWLAAPFTISLYHLRQDHIRYILAAYPAAALIAAIGFWWLVGFITKKWRLAPYFAVAALVSYLGLTVWRIQPYYLNYYNELVGGVSGVAARDFFRLGFYGEGIKEATEYINKTAKDGETIHYEVIPDDAPYLDRPRLVRYDRYGADYLIFNANAAADQKKLQSINLEGYQKVYAVKAQGAEFVWVYQKNQN